MFPCLNYFLYPADEGCKVSQKYNYHASGCMVWPISDKHSLSHTYSARFHPIAGPVTSLIMAVFLCINIACVRFYVLTVVTIKITALGVGIMSLKMDIF